MRARLRDALEWAASTPPGSVVMVLVFCFEPLFNDDLKV